jgi:carbon-monoxide dehydrogenase medium subunit
MKPAPFDYVQPKTLAAALDLLDRHAGAVRVIAGGQSLGPMLNLRLAQPELLVDVRAIPELRSVDHDADAVSIGACITHAVIEDGQVPDAGDGFMRHVAGEIAYRAIRNRGTIGGSLCHADPAADWVTALALMDAQLIIACKHGERSTAVSEFVIAPYTTGLADDEILTAIRVPCAQAGRRFGYYKVSRKPGEFADAIAAAMTAEQGVALRVVLAVAGRKPIAWSIEDGRFDEDAVANALVDAGVEPGSYELTAGIVALRRVLRQLQVCGA